MEAKQVLEVLKFIKGAYGNRFEINENTAEVWYRVLKDCNYTNVMDYVSGCAMDQDFPPSLADLRQSAGETQQQRYHQSLRDAAQERFANLEEWESKTAPPPPGNRERVMRLVRRD